MEARARKSERAREFVRNSTVPGVVTDFGDFSAHIIAWPASIATAATACAYRCEFVFLFVCVVFFWRGRGFGEYKILYRVKRLNCAGQGWIRGG